MQARKLNLYICFVSSDEQYMSRCIELALLGKGRVEPNPLVGAVVVLDDIIIGEGYHEKYGEAHAEVNAINSVEDQSVLKNATIYVSLEPCAHHGKTPPCADLIVKHSFKRVVIGSEDPNPAVNGKGIARLIDAGIEVETGILKDECDFVNRKFITYFREKRPYVLLKWAESPEGYIDCIGQRTWISSPEIQPLVHQWRSEYQSIMVGRKTVINDNPELSVRLVKGMNPIRIVIDPKAQIQGPYKILDRSIPTIVLNTAKDEESDNLKYIKLDNLSPESILHELYDRGVQSVMIEGGAFTIDQFINAGLWDEAKVIAGNVKIDSGTCAPTINRKPDETEQLFNNRIATYYNRR